MPQLRPKMQSRYVSVLTFSNKFLVRKVNECYDQAKDVIPPKHIMTAFQQHKVYTKTDYDNIIQKKERLILERFADLHPEGHSQLALQMYNTHESLKSMKVRKNADLV